MNTNTTEEINQDTGLVKFHNDVNRVSFTGFTKRELSVFYSLAKILDDKQDQELFITFTELKRAMNFTDQNNDTFIVTLQNTIDKLLSIHTKIQKENGNIITFVPFVTFEIRPHEKDMRVRVNPDYTYLFNMLTKNFTYFELKEFNQLKTKYSQHMFSLLKQYRNTGRLHISKEDFYRLLDVPEKYDARKVGQKILNPSMKELQKSFVNLEVKKIKQAQSITAYEFTFVPETASIANDENITTLEAEAAEAPSEPNDKELPVRDPSKLYCPHCGKEIVKRENKKNGTIFYGHKYYNHNESCRVTYNTLEDFQKDWAKVNEKKEAEQRKKQDAQDAWQQVVQKQQELFAAYKNKKE